MNATNGRNYLVNLLKAGRHTFSRADAEKALGKTGRALYMALRRLQQGHWLQSPVDGFYVIVDPQHQGFGVVPAEWIIDDLARHLRVDYYVSTLSAAVFHGASHQKPQRFQVVASRQIRKIDRGGYHLDFLYRNAIPVPAWEKMKCWTGYFRVSTPEMTAYDLLTYKSACPSLDHAATIYVEMGAKIRPDRLADLTKIGCELSVLQRVGWLLDATGWQAKTDPLANMIASQPRVWRALRSDRAPRGRRNERWRIVENVRIEPDIEKR